MDELYAECAKIAALRKNRFHAEIAVEEVVYEGKMRRFVEGGGQWFFGDGHVWQDGGQTQFPGGSHERIHHFEHRSAKGARGLCVTSRTTIAALDIDERDVLEEVGRSISSDQVVTSREAPPPLNRALEVGMPAQIDPPHLRPVARALFTERGIWVPIVAREPVRIESVVALLASQPRLGVLETERPPRLGPDLDFASLGDTTDFFPRRLYPVFLPTLRDLSHPSNRP